MLQVVRKAGYPRIDYTIEVLCKYILDVPFRLLDTPPAEHNAPTIYYGLPPPPSVSSIRVPYSGWLEKNTLAPYQPAILQKDDEYWLFPEAAADLPADIFAAAFFLLSRYEEYGTYTPDQHGRFLSTESMLSPSMIQVPLVDHYAVALRKMVQSRWPRFPFPQRQRYWHPTIDIDQAWAYLHKPWRTLPALLRDLGKKDMKAVKNRIAVLSQRQPDPYQVFDQLAQYHQNAGVPAIYFLLLGRYGPFDKNTPPRSQAMQDFVGGLAPDHALGLHPSYRSFDSSRQLKQEFDDFQFLTGQAATHSRQHYLRLRFPDTYQQLIQLGITDEYSMGYADQIGFRAGTAHPYPWYDPKADCMTSLMVHPLVIMDASLKIYQKMSQKEAKSSINNIWKNMKPAGGPLVTLWHNSSFGDIGNWHDWDDIYTLFSNL